MEQRGVRVELAGPGVEVAPVEAVDRAEVVDWAGQFAPARQVELEEEANPAAAFVP